jgi:two-component system response regulator NreC
MPSHLHLAPEPAETSTIRVVLAGGRSLVRRSLRLLLEEEQGVEVVGETGDAADVLGHVLRHAARVLVLELEMPSGSTFETVRRLHAEAPGTAIVVLTMEDSPVFARHALDAGALGFVLKDRADRELSEAVRAAARDALYTSPCVAPGLASLGRRLPRL